MLEMIYLNMYLIQGAEFSVPLVVTSKDGILIYILEFDKLPIASSNFCRFC